MPDKKLSNTTHRKVFFCNLKTCVLKNLSLLGPLGCENGHSSKWIYYYVHPEKKEKCLGNTFLIHPLCNLQENIHHNGVQKETMNLVPSWHHSFIFIFPQKAKQNKTS